MRALKYLFIVFLIFIIFIFLFFYFFKGSTSNLRHSSNVPKNELILRGEYLAKIGDCAACHTGNKGEFAGGIGLDSGTPVGLIFPGNITPDKLTGIGDYSLQDFDNALRHGIRKNGESLYPAMPYPSFSYVAGEDVEALYEFFMNGVKPVDNKVSTPSGGWPFTINWPVNAWRMIFAPDVTSLARFESNDNQVLRGEYLVKGLGHCGACHTPRNYAMAEVAFSNDIERRYLSGGETLEGWNAVNLRSDDMDGLGRMSKEQISELLSTGSNDSAAVYGSMAPVVNDSLQYLDKRDVDAIASYLKSLSPANLDGYKYYYDNSTNEALVAGDLNKSGSLIYLNTCAGCHRSDGKGYEKTFPSLAGNSSILNSNADSLISLVLRGGHAPSTLKSPTGYTMLGYSWRLDDEEAADLINFIRESWGNKARKIEKEEVKKIRNKFISIEDLRYQQAVSNDKKN